MLVVSWNPVFERDFLMQCIKIPFYGQCDRRGKVASHTSACVGVGYERERVSQYTDFWNTGRM